MRVDLPLDKKLWKIRTGGHRALAGRGPRAAGPSSHRAAGLSRAVGRGPVGRVPVFSKTHISSGGEKIIRFLLFEFVFRVSFAEDFGVRIDEILLKRNVFKMLLLFLRRLRNRSE